MNRGVAVVGDHAQQDVPIEKMQMLYNMVSMLKREIDMLKEQVEHLQQPHTAHAKLEDQFVDWENGQVIAPQTISIASEDIPEVPVEDTSKDIKLSDMERDTIYRALQKNRGNRKATALELGLSERTLYRKIKEYGL
jgi:transcriptional regulator with PAS, ATPase and Fis domain